VDHCRVFHRHPHGPGRRRVRRLHALYELRRPEEESGQDTRDAQRQDPVIFNAISPSDVM